MREVYLSCYIDNRAKKDYFKSMKTICFSFRLFLLAGVILCLLHNFSYAQTNQDQNDQLIVNYVDAVKSKNDAAIEKSIEELRDNKDALNLMKSKFPRAYRSYLWKSMGYSLNSLKNRLAGRSGIESSPTEEKNSVKRKSDNSDAVSSSRIQTDNRDLTRQLSTQDTLRNQSKVSNGEAVRNSPNERQPPNTARSVHRSAN